MSPQCQQAVADVGNGIAASLRGVDCLAGDMTQAAFGRLFGSGGALVPALTILLTIFIALFAFALITGRTSITIRSLTPRMVTFGLVITFATSWLAYQAVVWQLATLAPDQIASVMLGTEGPATQVFADKIDLVFAAIQEATSQQGQPTPEQVTTFSPQGLLWMGSTLLLLGTLGLLVTARIALAVLVAIGPVFVVMALFPATRGLFTGWLKGLVMLAIAPLFAVVGGTMMLELAVPVLSGLSPTPGRIDPRAAMAFFMIGAVHVALMVLMLKVASTMVGGWRVFGMADAAPREGRDGTVSHAGAATALAVAERRQGRSEQAAPTTTRRASVTAVSASVAANDISGGPAIVTRETRLIGGGASPLNPSPPMSSRAKGIGSRFRAAPARLSEKVK